MKNDMYEVQNSKFKIQNFELRKIAPTYNLKPLRTGKVI